MYDSLEKARRSINLAGVLSSANHGSLKSLCDNDQIRNKLKNMRKYLEANLKSIAVILEITQLRDIEHTNMNLIYFIQATNLHYDDFNKLLYDTWPVDYSYAQKNKLANKLIKICNVYKDRNKQSSVLQIIGNMSHELPKRQFFITRHVAAWKYFLEAVNYLSIDLAKPSEVKIKRSIKFPPELKQAGISILSYFSHILSAKYPDMEVSVTIEQTDDKVTLIIDSPEGECERIEKDLAAYGLIVIGEKSPEELLNDPLEIIRLKNKLEIAALELRQTRELLYSERQQYNARIHQLEETTKNIWSLLDKGEYEKRELLSIFKELNSHANNLAQQHLQSIMKYIENNSIEAERKNIQVLIKNIQNDDKNLFDYIQELVIKGSLQGVAGNYLYAFFQSIGWAIR